MSRAFRHTLLGGLIFVLLMAAALPVTAGEAPDLFPEAVPLSSGELAALRGGFSRDGLRFDFGIERVVLVNGKLESQTVFRLESHNFPASAGALSSPANLPVLVQNQLDQQHIRVVTVVNLRVGNLQAMRPAAIEAVQGLHSAFPLR